MTEGQKFAHKPEELLSEMRQCVLVLTINRQASYNSWTSALRDELARKLLAADADTNFAAVVLTGAGNRAFCSGQDLTELQELVDGVNIEAWLNRLSACYDSVRQFSKPLVAAMSGVAAGSGFQITQFCDYVVAHPAVRVGQTEVSSGLPSVFGTWLMWERVGRRAIELALLGRLMASRKRNSSASSRRSWSSRRCSTPHWMPLDVSRNNPALRISFLKPQIASLIRSAIQTPWK